MTVARTDENGDPIYFCDRHPEVETVIQCGRCDAPICPRCMVHTPGGIRCPDCARLRRPPMYELAPMDYAKAIGVAVVLAPLLGFIGALLIPARGFGGLFLILALFVGSGAGGLIAEALRRATNGKRGPVMGGIAAATLIGALLVRAVLAGIGFGEIFTDLAGLLIVAVGIFAAWSRLR